MLAEFQKIDPVTSNSPAAEKETFLIEKKGNLNSEPTCKIGRASCRERVCLYV